MLWTTRAQTMQNRAFSPDRAEIGKVVHSLGAKWPKLSTFAGPLGKTAIEGYSHKDIAEMLGIDEGTSRSQLAKARKVLQQQIQKSEGGSLAS